MNVFDILVKYQQAFADGLMVTFQMCLIIWSAGIITWLITRHFGCQMATNFGNPNQAHCLYPFRHANASVSILAALSSAIFTGHCR